VDTSKPPEISGYLPLQEGGIMVLCISSLLVPVVNEIDNDVHNGFSVFILLHKLEG
jgi:hypothetical protein